MDQYFGTKIWKWPCPDWKIPSDVHIDASDKQLGAVISQNDKPINLFLMKLINQQSNYTTTEKELLSIVECQKQFHGIFSGYEINVYSDHNNLVYTKTKSESQIIMCWHLILEEFGPNIHPIAVVDNIVSDMLSRLPSTTIY